MRSEKRDLSVSFFLAHDTSASLFSSNRSFQIVPRRRARPPEFEKGIRALLLREDENSGVWLGLLNRIRKAGIEGSPAWDLVTY